MDDISVAFSFCIVTVVFDLIHAEANIISVFYRKPNDILNFFLPCLSWVLSTVF